MVSTPPGRSVPGVTDHAVWVAGFPGFWGGADTELDHLIDLWRSHDVAVALVPMHHADPAMVESALERGCTVHAYHPGVFRDRTTVSFCNQNFLAELPRIAEVGPPRQVIWFNCMTWLFDDERHAHERGWIDLFGFVSDYQRGVLDPLLSALRPYDTFDYAPYFNVGRVPWRYRDWDGSYVVGRISRDNRSKFAPDTWRIFNRVLVPPTLHKRVVVLGAGPAAREVIGDPPLGLDARTWPCNAIPAREFYDQVDTVIHKTGFSRESYGRFVIESYAHGVVPIVEDDYAFPALVVHEVTGYRSSDSDEMSYWASVLAHDPRRHRQLAENGRALLTENLVDPERCWRPWEPLLRA